MCLKEVDQIRHDWIYVSSYWYYDMTMIEWMTSSKNRMGAQYSTLLYSSTQLLTTLLLVDLVPLLSLAK